jgi:hypothetical protein
MNTVKLVVFMVPFIWVTLSGPKSGLIMLAWTCAGVLELARRRRLAAIIRCWPIVILAFLWFLWGLVLALPVDINLLPPVQMVLGALYAVVLGVLISDLAADSDEMALRSLAVAFGVLCLVGAYVLSTVDYTQLINYSSGSLERQNPLFEHVVLRIFPVGNIVIGIIAFTLYSAAIFPLCVSRVGLGTRFLLFLAGAIAFALNVLVATRTCFAVMVVASLLMIAVGCRTAGILPTRKTLLKTGVLALPIGAVLGWIAVRALDLSSLATRLSQTNEDPRWEIWSEAARLALKHPNGGGYKDLTTHLWAHNLLLDSVLFYAWPGLLLVLAGGAVTSLAVLRQLWRRQIQKTGMALMMILTGACVTMMLMPPMLPLMLSVVVVYAYFRNVRMA